MNEGNGNKAEIRFNKIYVACPNGATSGGGETLHQLVHILNSMGAKAYIFQFERKQTLCNVEKFKKYEVEYVGQIEDDENNVLIVPETVSFLVKKYNKIKKVIWWLSLDFYFKSLPVYRTKFVLKKYGINEMFWPVFLPIVCLKFHLSLHNYRIKEDKGDIIHFYNCEYVKNYLVSHGIKEKNLLYLCGPIRDEYFDTDVNLQNKEDIIVYNPAKGKAFTKKLLKYIREQKGDWQIIPIQNMTPDEIIQLLAKAKLYIDFGEFPGPERIPREAALMGCAIVTSKNGSAGDNNIDIPIPEDHKFETDEKNIPEIVKHLEDVMKRFDECVLDYHKYKEKVIKQRSVFVENITQFFN